MHWNNANTHLIHVSASLFHGIKNLHQLHVSSVQLRTISKDFLLMNLSTFSSKNIHFCCLKSNTVIGVCENFGKRLKKDLCPFHYPKGTQVILVFLVLLLLVNILAMQRSYRF